MLAKRLAPKSKVLIYYDGSCSFCQTIVAKWQKRDRYNLLQFKSFREDSVHIELGVPLEQLNTYMHALNKQTNQLEKGLTAVIEITKRTPSRWFLLPLLYLAHLTRIGHLAYYFISKHRRTIPVNHCNNQSCKL
ncbi:thiol-disulfide oxidoreductase DCC family protein [Pontibacillus yanchengensis]|uniref:Thiol-disulfide oxidoreductase n=1 Tax=Pontibacillus yanchengensis Y32 TaxID=1385514 RepID=A0A0A2TFP8_9BACI|nr:DUF393 domain-containing protein [Pontibacillus yanchengensis]KGP74687.1 hypothetical protein N782_00515 [Pontibacillus yanchengensis Y32]